MNYNYRRKEQQIDAIQVNSYSTEWIKDYFAKYDLYPVFGSCDGDLEVCIIQNGKTVLRALYEMWIITTDGKKFFTLSNDIFKALYDKIDE